MDLLQNDVSEFFMFHFVRKDSFSALLSLASVLSETPSDLLEFPISDQFDSDGFDEVGGLRVAEQTVPPNTAIPCRGNRAFFSIRYRYRESRNMMRCKQFCNPSSNECIKISSIIKQPLSFIKWQNCVIK